MNDGGSTLGGNQTGSGGTDALNSTDLKISHDTSPSTPTAPTTPTTPTTLDTSTTPNAPDTPDTSTAPNSLDTSIDTSATPSLQNPTTLVQNTASSLFPDEGILTAADSLEISSENLTESPDTGTDTLSISHDDSFNSSSGATVSNPGNPDDEHVPILPPSSGPARLFGQDISGITDEDLSSSATAQPIPTTIFPGSTSTLEVTPTPDTTTQPTDSTFGGVYTAQTEATPTQEQANTTQNMATAPAPAVIPPAPVAPPAPTTPQVPYEQEFLESLHPETNSKTKDTGDIILDPTANQRKVRKGLLAAIVIAAVAVVVLLCVFLLAFSNKTPIAANKKATLEQSFYSYANVLINNTDSDTPVESNEDPNVYAFQTALPNYEPADNQEYFNKIYQKYNDFYNQVNSSSESTDSLKELANNNKELLDFLTINPASDEYSSDVIGKVYLEEGEAEALKKVKELLAEIPQDNQFGKLFYDAKSAEYDAAIDYLNWLYDLGCIEDQTLLEECSEYIEINSMTDEESPVNTMLQAKTAAKENIDSFYNYLNMYCWQINDILKETEE